jgi:hypothetical protein
MAKFLWTIIFLFTSIVINECYPFFSYSNLEKHDIPTCMKITYKSDTLYISTDKQKIAQFIQFMEKEKKKAESFTKPYYMILLYNEQNIQISQIRVLLNRFQVQKEYYCADIDIIDKLNQIFNLDSIVYDKLHFKGSLEDDFRKRCGN